MGRLIIGSYEVGIVARGGAVRYSQTTVVIGLQSIEFVNFKYILWTHSDTGQTSTAGHQLLPQMILIVRTSKLKCNYISPGFSSKYIGQQNVAHKATLEVVQQAKSVWMGCLISGVAYKATLDWTVMAHLLSVSQKATLILAQ